MSLKSTKKRYYKAFTLIEVLIVLVIIGILTYMAMPDQTGLISSTRSMEAQKQLKHLSMLQKMRFYSHAKYSNSFTEIGFTPVPTADVGGSANYKIEIIEASNAGFKARATAVTDFDADGVFNVWEIDQTDQITEITPD